MPEPTTPEPPSRGAHIAALLLLGVGAYAITRTPLTGPAPVGGDGVAEPAPSTPGRLVVDYQDGASLADIQAVEGRLGLALDWASPWSADEALRVGEVPDLAAAVAALSGEALVEVAEPAQEITLDPLDAAAQAGAPAASPPRLFGYPNDPGWEQQWNLGRIGAPAGWRVGGGAGVVVAVIDTGVTATDELPAERLLAGRCFLPGCASPADDHGHGTHVAGTIAQATHNGLGVAGVAPGATILPMKVLSAQGSGRTEWIAAAIDDAVDQGAQVINLSLGGAHSDVLVTAVEKARKAGVIVVAAAGNSGRRGLGSPADAPSAIGVSAVGPDDTLAPYSTWGKGVEIAAPGGDKRVSGGGIVQAIPGGKPGAQPDGKTGYTLAEWQGTSMASPHVAGAAAVLLGAGARSAGEVEALLETTADTRADTERYGAGRLDVAAAVRKLLVRQQGLLFLTGGTVGLALAALGGLRGLARVVAGLGAAVIAGGAFFLALLPLPPSTWLALLSRPWMTWPPGWLAGFPLWQSALVPLVVAVLFGPTRTLGPLAAALCAGVGSYLLYGALGGSTGLWWMPLGWGSTWLTLNGTASLLLGMAVAGMQRRHPR